jgi:glycosyltransferase involved in cell wall biosynthesis
MSRPQHILFHRPTLWSSDIQCSTKVLARLFAQRGYTVTYLENPLDPVHIMRGKGYLREWRQAPYSDQGVRIVNLATPVPVRDVWPLGTPMASYLKYRLMMPSLRSAVASDGRPMPDFVWTTVPGSVAGLKKSFPEARIVFHVVDYYPAFRGAAVIPLERQDYALADAVYAIGESLRAYLVKDLKVPAAKVMVLGQGAELEIYQREFTSPDDIAQLPHPRAIWCGVLSKGDPGLFRTLATEIASRNGSLALIGPPADWARELAHKMSENVVLLGSKPPRELPAYLKAADIGVMLYDRARQNVYRGQNPLKLYEYAAAGLPILSTAHDEFESLRPPVSQVSQEADVAPALDDILSSIEHKKAEASAFATRHSWQSKVDVIEQSFFAAPPNAKAGDRALC